MKKILAYLNGMREFRMSMTTHYNNASLADAYDYGRERMHRLTLRKFDV